MNIIDKFYMLNSSSYSQMMGYVYHFNNTLIVIDGGTKEDYQSLLNIINENGGVIDLLFVTHCHHDHIGALTLLLKNEDITIKKIIYDFPPLEDIKSILRTDWEYQIVIDFIDAVKKRNIPIFIPELNKTYEVGDFKYQFYKLGDLPNRELNDSSMVFKIISKTKSILFLGDISPLISDDFAMKYSQNNSLQCDYVQLAHHGQAGGSFKLYSLTHAKYGLWNAPRWLYDNDSGQGPGSGPYKTELTKKWLEALNIKSLTAFNDVLII